MTRIIRIKSCNDCPSRDNKGGFAKVAYVPVCRAVKPSRELPYTLSKSYGIVMAIGSDKIPNWCPLEKLP